MTTLCSCGFDGADFVTQHQIPAGAQFGCPRCDNTVNTGGSAAPEIYPAATVFGGADAATLQREHIVKLMATRAERPDSANGLRKVLRAMMTHAVEVGLRADDPTRDVRSVRVKSDGFHSWTDGEISQFEMQHSVGSRARLALALWDSIPDRRLIDAAAAGKLKTREEIAGQAARMLGDGRNLIQVAPHVATIPGAVFGSQGEGHVRFSYSTSMAAIQQGLDALRGVV